MRLPNDVLRVPRDLRKVHIQVDLAPQLEQRARVLSEQGHPDVAHPRQVRLDALPARHDDRLVRALALGAEEVEWVPGDRDLARQESVEEVAYARGSPGVWLLEGDDGDFCDGHGSASRGDLDVSRGGGSG